MVGATFVITGAIRRRITYDTPWNTPVTEREAMLSRLSPVFNVTWAWLLVTVNLGMTIAIVSRVLQVFLLYLPRWLSHLTL